MTSALQPGDADRVARARALALLAEVRDGERVVIRFHDGDGARDALGDVSSRADGGFDVATRRETVTVARTDVIAARRVPPPPPRRPRAV